MNFQQIQDFNEKYHNASADEQKKILDENFQTVAGANKAARKLGRVGMPMGYRLDSRTDEIPFLSGAKRTVVYVGGTVGTVIGVAKAYRWIFG